MNTLNIVESADWYRALTIKERIGSLYSSSFWQSELENSYNLELAQERLRKWRAHSPLKKDNIFVQRLTMEGITEKELLYILGEPIDTLKQRQEDTPSWLKMIFSAFANQREEKILIPVKLPTRIKDKNIIGFLDMIKPLISEGCEPLNKIINSLASDYTSLPFDPRTIKDVFLSNLLPKLLRELIPIMVKKCGEAREKGILKGNTSQERYEYFLTYMRQKDVALALLQEYPVLARRLVTIINNWATFSIETLERLCKDWANIQHTFTPDKDPGVIVLDKDGSVGDPHRNGQVITLTFSSGFKLLYKPRSLSIDVHFQELLAWLNDNGAMVDFHTLKVLDCGNYGWIEFVNAQDCYSEAEVERFYYRHGGYLALLYAVGGVDFHYENLIAVGEHPILVDLEALFCQTIKTPSTNEIERSLQDSIMRIGLLPERIFGNNENIGMDFSGFAGLPGQLTPFLVPQLEATGTDEIHIVRKQAIYQGANTNRPKLNGNDVVLWDYVETIIKGFTDIYHLLQKNAAKLTAVNGAVTAFASDEVRIILRSTKEYGTLLREGSTPNMLRNTIACEWLFDNLWGRVEDYPFLLKALDSERESLLDGFIPRFITRPNSRDLWSDNNKCITNFFPETGMSYVKNQLEQFSEDHLARQIWFIRASFASLSEGTKDIKHKNYQYIPSNKTVDHKDLIKKASVIGDSLVKLSVSDQDKTDWLGLQISNLGQYYISSSKIDLYEGLPGIGLFLAYLAHITKQPVYNKLAQGALASIRSQIKQPEKYGLNTIGGFAGYGGIIHMFTHLARLWNTSTLLNEAVELANLVPPLIEKDKSFDLIFGAAGCIISLVNLCKFVNSQQSQQIVDIAIQCGKHLIANVQTTPQGKGWITTPEKTPALGMSHGVAGIAWALLELSNLTKDTSFASVAREALNYERSFFSEEEGNWLNLNKENNQKFSVNWCHGAPGIGMARLCSLDYLPEDTLVKQEIDIAVKTVIAKGFGNNHSLCHGDLGNLDFLIQVSEKFPDHNLQAQIQNIASTIFDNIDKSGWLCGTPFSIESPGLMVGMAGIGYQLLRLAVPDIVPSVLSLAPPKL